jgi:hypothetical protein
MKITLNTFYVMFYNGELYFNLLKQFLNQEITTTNTLQEDLQAHLERKLRGLSLTKCF